MSRSSHASGAAQRFGSAAFALVVGAAVLAGGPAANAVENAPDADGATEATETTEATDQLWTQLGEEPPSTLRRKEPAVRPDEFTPLTLDRSGIAAALAAAPDERPDARARANASGLELALPTPDGDFARFALEESAIMEPGLAAKHPEIKTYVGRGIDEPAATIRADLTPLGFHASVRSPEGSWYIDPYYERDQSVYVSYYGRDLAENPHGTFVEHGDEGIAGVEAELGDLTAEMAEPDAAASTTQLRTYRLALISDPTYANYFGAANVTAAKVTLMNRVNQIYEDETAIRMILVADNDRVNLDTQAEMTGADGPCGSAPCYTPSQARGCGGSTLNRNRIVLGQRIGAANYDIGHIVFGLSGGGIAGLGVVGGDGKARGCTGLPNPVGDYFGVDYVAHEMGHQFAANHTFNGNQANCSGGNRNGATSVEPGSGSSIMAYAGICRQDDLQPHTDPYWSQRSFEEISTFVTADLPAIDEVQTVSLRGFDNDADSFTIGYGRNQSSRIVRGSNYTTADIEEAIETSRRWPEGATVEVDAWGGSGPLTDAGFEVTFGGTWERTDVDLLAVNGRGVTGFVGDTAEGGPVDNKGFTVTDTGNHAPSVDPVGSTTIPYRTPFELTGNATDVDGDTVTYMWEQNDRGLTPVALVDPVKTNGPLFRQFGTALDTSLYDPQEYDTGGTNSVTTDPSRVFPDLTQILANNTNAETGDCPGAPAPPPPPSGGTNVPAELIDCYSEFLPTAAYAGPMHFRVTARDGNPGGGGVASADTTVSLAPGTGPFLVTSQNDGESLAGASTQTVSWDVAGTDLPPISTEQVRISVSTDGGLTYPHELAAGTANDGSAEVTLPNVSTDAARIKVEPVDNVYFDLNNADFTIRAAPEVSNDAPGGTTSVQYSDAVTPVAVTASDADSAGSELTATADGLPEGVSLAVASTSDDAARPGARTWTVTGTADAAPGSYPVSVTVDDGSGAAGTTSFVVEVTPEDAAATYVGDTLAFTAPRAPGADVELRATVRDSSVLAGSTDEAPGDVRNATVTFLDSGTTLCEAVPVRLTGAAGTSGSAVCEADLGSGSHSVEVVVGGWYDAPAASAVVDVPEPDREFVTGSGRLRLDSSDGAFAADPGSRADLKVNARLRGQPIGQVRMDFTADGDRHRIEATSLESFGAADGAAEVRGVARLTADGGRVSADDATVRIALVDGGSPGRRDEVAVTLWGADGRLLFSSAWAGDRTLMRNLSGGNLKLHG